MPTQTTPVHITLLEIISSEFEKIQPACTRRSDNYKNIEKLIKENINLFENPLFTQNKQTIHFIQLLMISALTFYGGVNIPPINQCQKFDSHIKIIWDTGNIHTIYWGINNETFKAFATYFQIRLSKRKVPPIGINPFIFRGIYQYIVSYQNILNECQNQYTNLLNKTSSQYLNTQNLHPELILIYVSCLPHQSLNQLLFSLNKSIPEDILIKTNAGNTIHLKNILEKTSTQAKQSFEKCQKLFETIFNTNDNPINLKTIINELKKQLQNPDTTSKTNQNLKNVINYQIKPRLTLYEFLISFLNPLVNNEKNLP